MNKKSLWVKIIKPWLKKTEESWIKKSDLPWIGKERTKAWLRKIVK